MHPVHVWLYLHMALRIRFNLLRHRIGLITSKRWQETGIEGGREGEGERGREGTSMKQREEEREKERERRSDTLNWLLMERHSHRAVEI